MEKPNHRSSRKASAGALALLILAAALLLTRCGTAGGSSGAPPTSPTVQVTVSPATAIVQLGQQQQFSASVAGTSNTSVAWQVNGVIGGDPTNGTIATQGLYTAPASMPSNPVVTVRAVSQADSSASGSASVTLTSGVQVSLSPASASVPVGTTQQFTAHVTAPAGQSTAVNWSLTGSACPASCGSLSSSGNTATYSAPASVPPAPTISIVATSVVDPAQSATATVTVVNGTCSPAVSVAPSSATLPLGTQQNFTATVCSGSNQNVTWSIATAGCGGTNCGIITSTVANTATYTAPSVSPPVNPITLLATNTADSTQSGSATITITSACAQPISISPSAASMALSQQQSFTATVCFTTNQTVTWSISGSGCTGAICGTVSSTGANTATFTAPSSLPPSNPLNLVATSASDPTKIATATITISSGVGLQIDPRTVQLATRHRRSFAATVAGSSNQAVTWAVNGVPNGNTAVGQICVAGSNPCSVPSGPAAAAIDYLAPDSVPSPSTVTITAMSSADPSISGAAAATILPDLQVAVWPVNAVVAPSGTVEFVATAIGSSNDAVTWKASCTSGSCGSITAAGVYTAPAAAPSPNQITITATSQDDSTQSASATVALTSSVALSSLAPASVATNPATAFPVLMTGYHFVPTSPGPGTKILIGGTPRAATCPSPTDCTVTLQPTDLASAGSLSLQAQNPDGSLSNTLSLSIVPTASSVGVISLSSAAPIAPGKDFVAVDSTTLGAAPATPPMAVLFLGLVDNNGACNVNFSPITIARPSTGSATYTICVGGNGIDSSNQVIVAGSQSTDVTVSGIAPFEGSMVQMTLTISSTTAPGLRALIFTDENGNRAAATGAIDVE